MGSIIKVKREFPPKDFSLAIDSFSKLAYACNNPENAKYESVVLSAEGYSWKLQLYPNGNTKSHGNDHISLYLAIVDLPPHQEVNVELKFFVFDKKKDNYFMIQDGGTKRFHEAKTEWGYDKLLSLDVFKDPHNGYLVKDHCEFGVEIFKLAGSKTEKRQTWSIVKPDRSRLPIPFKRIFKDFSRMLDKDFYYADSPIAFGGQTWYVPAIRSSIH